jgi:potassium efflux system protein
VIKVGVAYGSDTDRVCSTLLRLGSDHPLVLDQPEPQVFFDAFGDSALNFELRVFVRSPDAQRIVRHDLNMAVERAFREAGIEIPFPQRDVHIRTAPSDGPAKLSPRERGAR